MKKYFWRNFILIFSVAVITIVVQLGILIFQYRSSRTEWMESVYTRFVQRTNTRVELSDEDGSELDALYEYLEDLDDNRISMYRIYDSQGNEVLKVTRYPDPGMRPRLERALEEVRPGMEMQEGDYVGSFEIEAGDSGIYTVGLYSYNPATYTYTKDLINSCINSILISIPVCLVIAVVLSFLISRKNTSTVNEIRKALDDLSSGKHGVLLDKATKSELEEIASDIQNLDKILEADERGRKAWLTSISHDLSTPATGIKIITDGLSDGVFEADSETVESLKHEADTLNERISKVVDYSTLQSRKVSLSRFSCKDFASSMAMSFGEKLEITYDDGELCADRALMEKACRELLLNAFTFGCDVSLSVGHDGKNCFIKVLNTGKLPEGLSGDVLFEPWSRADSSRHAGGTGLGLPIVGTIAMLHGGKAELSSVSDSKVCASIVWPVK